MAVAAILKIAFFDHNSSTDFSDFSEILYEEAERHADKGHMTKNCKVLKSKMADGRHFENR